MFITADQYRVLYEGSTIVAEIREYILGIVAAAILCALVLNLAKGKSANTAVIRTICGIIMTITVISPLARFKLQNISLPDLDAFLDGSTYANNGYGTSINQIKEVIKQRSEAYVLEKANTFDCDLKVNITVSDDNPPRPASITLSGNASPVTKQKLKSIIEKDLGIPMECQLWN